jgi:PAS domain S-box-containing protein
MEALPTAVVLLDPGGRVVEVNEAFCQMTGFAREDVLGLTKAEFLPMASEKTTEVIESALKGDGSASGIPHLAKKDGSRIPVALHVSSIQDGSSVVVVEDLTERLKAADRIRRGEEKFEMAFYGTSAEMALVRAHDGLIIDANDPWLQIMGYSREEAVGKTMAQILAWKHPEKREEWVRDLRKHGRVYGREYEFITKDGKVIVVLVSGQMIKFDGENMVLNSAIDITDRKRAEEALRRANEKLSMLNSITRHDMINQISVISGYLDLAKRKSKDPVILDYLAKIARGTTNLEKQIAFTKDYQDMGVKAPIWVNVGKTTRDAFSALAPEGVLLEEDGGGIDILADQLVEKVPYNLIDNSMRHGGKVTKIRLSAAQIGDGMMIIYEDDGCGISEVDRKFLFEKGYGKHSGLGLFLAREILAITGISIEERGKEGAGVRFEILVPPGAWRRMPEASSPAPR